MTLHKKKKKTPRVIADLEIPRAALELWRFASTQSKPNMHVICLEPEAVGKTTTIHAVASDGSRLVHTSWLANDKDVLRESIHLEAEEVKDFLSYSMKSASKRIPKFRVKHRGSQKDSGLPELILSANDKKAGSVGTAKAVAYPSWRHVMPKDTDAPNDFSHKFSLDLKFLTDFGKYLSICGCGSGVHIFYADETASGPVLIKPGTSGPEIGVTVDLEYIAMPMKL